MKISILHVAFLAEIKAQRSSCPSLYNGTDESGCWKEENGSCRLVNPKCINLHCGTDRVYAAISEDVFAAYTFENEEILPEISDSCSGVQLRGKYFQYTAGVNSCGAKVSQGFDPEYNGDLISFTHQIALPSKTFDDMYLLRPEVKIEFTCSYPIHVNIDTDDFETHQYDAKSHIIGDEVLRTEVKVEIATDVSVDEAEQLLDKETEEFDNAAEALKELILDSWPEDLEKPIEIVVDFIVKETNQPELHLRKRRESEPFQIAEPILLEQLFVEKIVFASISFIYETKTTPTSLDDSEDIEETERDIVSTANLLAEKTEEIVHEIVADSQKVPKSTGSSVDEISFTGIVVSAGVTAEIIGKTKITSKGDIAAIGSWGNSFNLKLSGDVNGKFYMGVPINGVLSSMLRIPQLLFFIDTCKYSCGDETGVNLIEGSCYASVLGVENINPNASRIVDEVSQFRFKSFSFTEDAKPTSCTIICSVNTCLADNCAPPQCEGGVFGYN